MFREELNNNSPAGELHQHLCPLAPSKARFIKNYWTLWNSGGAADARVFPTIKQLEEETGRWSPSSQPDKRTLLHPRLPLRLPPSLHCQMKVMRDMYQPLKRQTDWLHVLKRCTLSALFEKLQSETVWNIDLPIAFNLAASDDAQSLSQVEICFFSLLHIDLLDSHHRRSVKAMFHELATGSFLQSG